MTKLRFDSEPFEAYPGFDELKTARRTPPVRSSRTGMGRQRSPHSSARSSGRPRLPVTVRPGARSVLYGEPSPCICPAHVTEFVRWVQSSLNQIQSLRLPIDGVMSPAARSALRRFQEQHGLPINGIAGPETEKALIDAKRSQSPEAGEPPAPGEFEDLELDEFEWEEEVNRSSRDYAMWVQSSLNKILGLGLAVDGIIGTQTRSAIRTFQSQHGLVVDGIVGPQTEAALMNAGAVPPPGSSYIPSPSMPSTPNTPKTPSSGVPSETWVLPPDVRAAGEAQFIRYDSPPTWAGGRNCSGSFTRGAEALQQYIYANFPGITSIGGYNCRENTGNPSETSVHGTGRAFDIMIPEINGQANSGLGDPIANWLVRNAQAIGVQYIIWNHVQWSGAKSGRKDRPYTGPYPHTDHIHVELNNDGAERRAPWFQDHEIAFQTI